MAKIDLTKSIRGLSFFTKNLNFFGTKQKIGDQFVFDRRGAIRITDKELVKPNGEIIKIRGIADSGRGGGSSMAINRPGSGNKIDASRAMDAYHGWTYAASKAISDEVANIEFKVFRVNKDGNPEEITEHEVLDLLEGVNDFQTSPEFKHTLSDHLNLTGNAYILLEGVKDEMSKPTSLHLLNPSRVKVVLNRTTYPFKIDHYEFTFDQRMWTYKPYQIIQLKIPNPSDPYMGIGPVQGIAEWIDNDNNTTEFLRQFFMNGAQIGLTFETEMSSEEQLEELATSFNERHQGVQNAYKGLFLPKGVKKPTNDVAFKDLGIGSISDNNRDRILAGFRVSKTILGTAESDTNRSTAETADYVFSKRTIKPMMILVCSYLNEFLVPRFGDDIFISFYDNIPEDKNILNDEMTKSVAGIPLLTVNEARAKYLKLPEIDGGDILLAPNTFAPAIDAGKTPPTNYTMSAKDAAKKKIGYIPSRISKGKTGFAKNVIVRKEMASALAQKIAAILMESKKKNIDEMNDIEYEETILKAKRDRIGNYKKAIKTKLVDLNDKQKEDVLANLASSMKGNTKAFDVTKLFDLKKWIGLTVTAITPVAKDLFSEEAKRALEVIDKPGLDIDNTPAAQEAIANAMSLMSESYNLNTVDALEAKITQGLEQGYGAPKIAELVQEIYTWKNEVAADRVALTESNRIANDASKIAWKESGVVKELKWVTSQNDVCIFCQKMEGKTIDIDDNYFDKGDSFTVDGEVLDLDYSDVGGPPLHPNCHCAVRPVINKKILVPDILGK